jgi:hypothetical protein
MDSPVVPMMENMTVSIGNEFSSDSVGATVSVGNDFSSDSVRVTVSSASPTLIGTNKLAEIISLRKEIREKSVQLKQADNISSFDRGHYPGLDEDVRNQISGLNKEISGLKQKISDLKNS